MRLLEVFQTTNTCKHKADNSSHTTSATSAKVINQTVQLRPSQEQKAAADLKKRAVTFSPEPKMDIKNKTKELKGH